jgi:hypothetical protein
LKNIWNTWANLLIDHFEPFFSFIHETKFYIYLTTAVKVGRVETFTWEDFNEWIKKTESAHRSVFIWKHKKKLLKHSNHKYFRKTDYSVCDFTTFLTNNFKRSDSSFPLQLGVWLREKLSYIKNNIYFKFAMIEMSIFVFRAIK